MFFAAFSVAFLFEINVKYFVYIPAIKGRHQGDKRTPPDARRVDQTGLNWGATASTVG